MARTSVAPRTWAVTGALVLAVGVLTGVGPAPAAQGAAVPSTVVGSEVAPTKAPSPRRAAPRAVTLVAPSTGLAGSRVRFTGRVLSTPRGTKVKIQRLAGRTWKTSKTVTTGTGGRFTASVVLKKTGRATYRAYTTRRNTGPKSATVRIAVLRRVSVQLRSDRTSVVQGTALTLTVRTAPAQTGGSVQLQSRTAGGAWVAAGKSTLTRAGATTFRPRPATTGTVQYRVLKPRHGYDAAAASASVPVTVKPKVTTFGQLMKPASTKVLDPAVATWSFRSEPPTWWANNAEVRWDTAGAFTHSLTPKAAGTYTQSMPIGGTTPDPTLGAEYNNGNSSLQTVDVSFEATGTTFAIRYQSYGVTSAMVWIDGHPVAAKPIPGVAPANGFQRNWVQVNLPSSRTVQVRIAGPHHFFGVDHDANVPLTVKATPTPYTVGVVSDSYFDSSVPYRTYEGSAAAVLHTRTGFRIWSLAEAGTGYLNDATGTRLTGNAGFPGHYASPFGSEVRLARMAAAPIDALLINGGINDFEFDNVTYAAAVNRYLDRIAELRPGLPVVIVGIQPVTVSATPSPDHQAALKTKNQILKGIAAQHENVVGFIDPLTEKWLTGTGTTAAPMGNGNQDIYVAPDRIHMSPAGQVYYQDLIADRLAPLRAR